MNTIPARRRRLAFACNYCRSRKTRCDERQPSCTACLQAGIECITTDKRRQGIRVNSRRRNTPAALYHETVSPRSIGSILSAPSKSFTLESAKISRQTVAQSTEGSLQSNSGGGYSSFRRMRENKQTDSLRASCSPYCPHSHVESPDRTKERYKGRLPMMPVFSGTTTLQLMKDWLDLAFCRLGVHESAFDIRDSVDTAIGHNCSISSTLASSLEPPDLPSYEETTDCLSDYMSYVHAIFPISIGLIIERNHAIIFSGADTPKSLLAEQEAPFQAIYYLALTLGLPFSSSSSMDTRLKGGQFIAYSHTLLGHLIGHRSVPSVQAIFLLSLALRECDRISESSDVLKLAISMAQSLHLDRSQSAVGGAVSNVGQEGKQTWWCILVLEKMLLFDTGQPTTIHDFGPEPEPFGLDVVVSSVNDEDDDYNDHYYFHALIGLAKTLYEINEQSFKTWNGEESLHIPAEDLIREKLQTAGRLVIVIEAWYDSLSRDPTFVFTSTTTTNVPRRAFLTAQYYYMLILLNRTTLLVDPQDLMRATDKYGTGHSWHESIRSAPNTCVEAARNMIMLLVRLDEIGKGGNCIVPMSASLAASYVLSVRIISDPNSKLNRSDYEVTRIGIEFFRSRYEMFRGDETFKLISNSLDEYMIQCLDPVAHFNEEYEPPIAELPTLPTGGFFPANGSRSQTEFNMGPQAIDWAGWNWGDLSAIFSAAE